MSKLIALSLLTAALWAQTPPRITGITQLGSNTSQLSPGAWAFLRGTGLSAQPKISVNGVSATVLGSSDTVAFFQIPPTTTAGQASLVVTAGGGASAPFSFVLAAASPV